MRKPRRTRNRLLVTLLIVSLTANVVAFLPSGTSRVGQWRTREARDDYLAAYNEVKRAMPKPTQEREVPTAYGSVHVEYYAGPHPERTPFLLIPGWGSGVPMWQVNLPGLLAERPVYALDGLGDAGLSNQVAPLDSPAAQAAWIDETVNALGVPKLHVVGHSFGGWSAANFVLRHPEHVTSLSLLDPVQVFSTFRWQVYLYAIPAGVPLLPQSWRDKALAKIGGTPSIDRADPMTRMIDEGTKGYVSRRSFPQQLTDDQLRAIRVPTYAGMAGASSVLSDPAAAVRRAQSLVPTVEARVWPGATHSFPMEEKDAVDAELVAFAARHDG